MDCFVFWTVKKTADAVFFREGISLLMGYSKNYNVLGGYAYYNTIPHFLFLSVIFTNITI